MEYATYDFYTNEYKGDSVDESLFEKWLVRATDKLNAMTYGNIDEKTVEEYPSEIAKAVCALIDNLYMLDQATKNKNSVEYGNVKSMTSGGQSVSFGTNETIIDKAVSDKKAQEAMLYNAVCDYLYDTGLLYGGV